MPLSRSTLPLAAALTLTVFAISTAQDDKTPEDLLRDAREAEIRARELAVRAADAFDARGSAHFKAGRFKESVADFDQAVALDARRKPWHWRRGISYYYTKQYVEGQRQFEGYQTVDDSDVENAAWRYLCMARKYGVEKAQKEILRVGNDRRVPMRQIYDLFAGKIEPEKVLETAKAGDPPPPLLNRRLFYAHLYLGLYWEVQKKPALAKKHLVIAADKHKIGHYMWDVAKVHADLYREAKSEKKDENEPRRKRGSEN